MANTTLIMGESGTGKSTSIRTLDAAETFIINVLDKPLPFRGFKQKYKSNVNYFATDDYNKILKAIDKINREMPHIKNIIIDDFQYIMSNEFMRRASERGFDKFTEISQHAWSIARACCGTRDDLYCFLLSHTECDASGKIKAKTIGKMLDDKITFEGMFTTILHSMIVDGKYKFLTQNDGCHIARSPMDMFNDLLIDNDLNAIKNVMIEYCEMENSEMEAALEDEKINTPGYSLAVDSILSAGTIDDLTKIFRDESIKFKENIGILAELKVLASQRKNEICQGAV